MGERAGILRYLKDYDGGRTFRIAKHLCCACAAIRRELIKMEGEGLVRRNERYSSINCIFWEITP